MAKPTGAAVTAAALALLRRDPPIAYSEMDCQAFVKACVREAGGSMQAAGSNDIYRNHCAWTAPLAQARADDRLMPGALLFIVAPQSDATPTKYRGDGLGDASHVGLYTGDADVPVVHSSASKGRVVASTLANGWTHAGWASVVAEGTQPSNPVEMGSGTAAAAAVDVPEGEHLRMRETPSPQGAYMLRIPCGTRLDITARQNGFARTRYGGHTGWVDERFLRYDDDAQPPQQPEGSRDDRLRALLNELASLLEADT